MLSVEPTLVQCVKEARAMLRRPLTPNEFLEIANDLVKGTETERNVVEFKKVHCGVDDGTGRANLSKGYYSGFMKRNKHLL